MVKVRDDLEEEKDAIGEEVPKDRNRPAATVNAEEHKADFNILRERR